MGENISIDVNQYILLEYAALTNVLKKKIKGEEMTKTEEDAIINNRYQQEKWMKKGFISQGEAFCEGREEKKGMEWLEESLTFL